jgi:hypothetical protein
MSTELGAPDRSLAAPPGDGSDQAVAQAVERLTQAMASGAPCAPIRDVLDRGDVARAYRVHWPSWIALP